MDEPKFFRFVDRAIGGARVPMVVRPDVRLGEVVCSGCGSRLTPRLGVPSCSIEGGGVWVDIIGNPSWAVRLFSQDVLNGLAEIRATGYSASQTSIIHVESKQLRSLAKPSYYYFDITGRIDVDLIASGLDGVERCPVCFRILGDRHPEACRFVPAEDQWDGTDLFMLRNQPNSMMFCSRRVIELARRERWTNFYFEPMDVLQRHTPGWGGIDYLGPEWPPSGWYPTPPSAGKSLSEWLVQIRSDDADAVRRARIAVSDIAYDQPRIVIPELVKMLEEPDNKFRSHVARMLGLIHSHSRLLPPEVRERIKPLVSDFLRSKLE